MITEIVSHDIDQPLLKINFQTSFFQTNSDMKLILQNQTDCNFHDHMVMTQQ
jgi:hypothetical protein